MKKPKKKKKELLSANDVRDYLSNKFGLDCDPFWDWFFSESSYGDTNLLSMDLNDVFDRSWLDYIKIIKNEFYNSDEDEFDDFSLEIENDL